MPIWSSEIKELETLSTSIKGRFPELEKEMERLVKADDENMVLLYSRRCLEVIITNLCESELNRPRKTEPLKGIIDKLNREEKVPSNIIASMQSLNSLSTFGAHPKDFDPRQVKPVLNNLTTIIEWYLKYKDTKAISKPKSDEVKDETKSPEDSTQHIQEPKKRSVLLLSGLALVVVIVIVALFVFNIIGGKKQVKVDTNLEKSIAVKPFYNLSGDPGQDYMSIGLTDEVINHLYKIASFDKVVSLSTVLTYKETDKQLPQIADELKVNYILEGTYKKIGDQVRVTAQLIEPKNDRHIWQNEYDLPYKELITIQADIAIQIADHLKAYMTESEKQIVQNVYIPDQEAYQLLQKSKDLYYSQRGGTNREDIELAIQVTLMDPGFADAYAWAGAMILSRGLIWWGGTSLQSVAWDALNYFEKALELDQNIMMGHIGMAAINIFQKYNYVEAEKEFLKAIELAPNNAESYGCIEFFIQMKQLGRAMEYINKVKELEGSENLNFVTLIHILSGNRDEAQRVINKRLDLYGYPNIGVGRDYVWLEEYDSAYVHLKSAEITRDRAYLAIACHKTGKYQQANDIKNQLINQSKETIIQSPAYFTGLYYSAIGEVDSAFYWLEKAFVNRTPEMAHLKTDPAFNNLKNDDRYWDLYARTGHNAYDEYKASQEQ